MSIWKTPDVKPDIFRPHRILVIYEAHDEPELMFSAEYAALTADRYVNRWCYWDEFIAAADRVERMQVEFDKLKQDKDSLTKVAEQKDKKIKGLEKALCYAADAIADFAGDEQIRKMANEVKQLIKGE